MTIYVYRDSTGQFRWRQVARNGRTVADGSESYTRRADCVKAARRVASSRPEVIVEEER